MAVGGCRFCRKGNITHSGRGRQRPYIRGERGGRGGGGKGLEEAESVDDGEVADFDNVAVADGDGEDFFLEPGALADGAGNGGHVLLDLLPPVLSGLLVAPHAVGNDALERSA